MNSKRNIRQWRLNKGWYGNPKELSVGTLVKRDIVIGGEILRASRDPLIEDVRFVGVIMEVALQGHLSGRYPRGEEEDKKPVAYVQWLYYMPKGCLFAYNENRQ